MNIERLEFIASWLEAGGPHRKNVVGFHMGYGLLAKAGDPACGTVCCIAGAASQFFGDVEGKILRQALDSIEIGEDWDGTPYQWDGEAEWSAVFYDGASVLGLESSVAEALFIPEGNLMELIDAAWAARTIRHLIATGKVDWDATKEIEE